MKLMSSWRILIACLVVACTLGSAAVTFAAAELKLLEGSWYAETPSSRYITGKLGVVGNITLNEDAKNLLWLWGADQLNPLGKTRSTQWDIAGRWGVVSNGGDPDQTADDNLGLTWYGDIFPCYYFGYWKVKIGDKIFFIGDGNTGQWTKVPYTYAVPPAGYGVGRSGGYTEGEWTIRDGTNAAATFRIRMSVVRDQVRFELTVTNKATTSASIGVQMVADCEVGDSALVGYPYIPGIGFSRQPAVLVRPQGMILSGSSIPEVLDIVDNLDNPQAVARCSLRIQDCVTPDYVAVGEYREITDIVTPMWLPNDFTPDPLKPIDDLAWALCWAPKSLRANASRKIVTYYGIGAASTVWNYRVGSRMEPDSVALAVQGPRALKYDSVNGTNELDAQPFEVKAYVNNLATDPGPYNLEDVTVSLYLPPGLELAPTPPQSAQQAIGRVTANSEASPATWEVQATGDYAGELQYFVTAKAASGWQQVVSRKIMVPATKRNVFRYGYQLMSVPFSFNNTAIEHVFGLARGSFGAKYYDPVTKQYLPVSQLTPGQAFWMYAGSVSRGETLPFELAGDATIVGQQLGKQVDQQFVDLLPGWNMVSNPFVYPIYWGQVLVWNKSGNVTVSLDQAVTYGWLSKTVYAWIPESGTYESFKDSDRLLVPWRGYWVRAKSPVTLVFRPAVPLGSDVTANSDGT